MNNPGNLLIADLEVFLKNKTQHLGMAASLDGAFFSWAFGLSPSINLDELPKGHEKVAILGFYKALDNHKFSASFQPLLNWLADRPLQLQGTPTAIVLDPLAILGVLIGVASDQTIAIDGSIKTWLESLLSERKKLKEKGLWADFAINLLAEYLGLSNQRPFSESADIYPVRILMHSKGFLRSYPEELGSEDVNSFLTYSIREEFSGVDNAQAIIVLAALKLTRKKIEFLEISVPGIQTLLNLLKRVPEALSIWTWEHAPRTRNAEVIKWDIQNEYHVQNLLHLILKPIFPDIKPEESLTSSGHVHPRVDFFIPSLRVAIEVKFLRSSQQSVLKNITEEIASDAHHYRIEKNICDDIVVFIWDDSRSTEEHSKLKDAIEKMEGVRGAVIVSRPGKMVNN